ncbi:carboxymuconolactone decarboxylase family protein [Streptomyces sp. 4503]|uniref:Carboxymuconolactone decarboxylase family protein n=1 Tax=Streptomyces niphimycinicus TaxID=2842201 RepID=A0ABS6CHU4_9ACTN|nr:carboxymuconolactone decarboxylase family protein [Streptomyces niphimycinicus]MBU3866462.1 carboxymuconolactone decarboxylase family protein [Streptomyces niphimycinicus]
MTTTTPARTTARLDLKGLAPEVSAAMGELHRAAVRAARAAGVEPELLELVRIRASQLNGCAFCLDMHTKDARAQGESEQRMHTLGAWRETPFFTERERAALALAEAVTSVQDGQVPDEVYAAAREVFDEPQVTAVIWAAVVINACNRTAISARMVPGAHQPAPRS